MEYNNLASMTTTTKDKLIEGDDIRQLVSQYENKNKMSDGLRTPKRQHDGEGKSNTVDDETKLSDDESDFEVFKHQRKRF
jgi:hypothetical protein